jgi:hypothetical protein
MVQVQQTLRGQPGFLGFERYGRVTFLTVSMVSELRTDKGPIVWVGVTAMCTSWAELGNSARDLMKFVSTPTPFSGYPAERSKPMPLSTYI